MIKPKFKDHYQVDITGEAAFLLAEDNYHILSGRIYPKLAPLLNGQHSVPAIVGQLAGQLPPGQVYAAIKMLDAAGHLTEGSEREASAADSYWQALGAAPDEAEKQLADRPVSLHTLGSADSAPLAAALAAGGATFTEEGFPIVVTDDYLQPELAELNARFVAANQPWMLVKLVGRVFWIGPIFEPGVTGCWECLADRLRSNRQVERFVQNKTGSDKPLPTSRPYLATTVAMAANLAANEALKWLVQGQNTEPRQHGLLTFDTQSAEMTRHALTRRPQCPACGDPAARQREFVPITLQSQPKRFSGDGGHRTRFPAETVAANQHHISPITGVITSLYNIIEDVSDIAYSFTAGHNFAMMANDVNILRQNLRGRSGGKGMSAEQARASAIGEAIERYSAVFRNEDELRLRASYQDLGGQGLHLQNEILFFSEKQYANRLPWNRQQKTLYHMVPNPFDEKITLDWSPIWSLTSQEKRYIPTSYCYYGHPELHHHFSGADSNGSAAGNSLEEAIFQGFLEVVERDAIALWWYNRLDRPGVDLTSFGITPYVRKLTEFYGSIGRELWVIDITSDLNIPTFAAISRRLNRDVEDIIIGCGAHLDPKIAVLRALTEMNQFLFPVLHDDAEGKTIYRTDEWEAIDWFQRAKLAEQPYLAPAASLPLRAASDFPKQHHPDLRDDIEHCVAIAQKAGLEVFVLDQTRADVGFPVCKVIVPGLRHFWRRLGPGRLYDVPVAQGWLQKPVAEDEMNPFSMFF
ncbi:MAG: TOMM precursor leader peptide-binding protein [Ardenticatenales bacterium]|nr:TOMM precursor leader peptide-binding protein [Ardenticatenales bacterium]